GHGRPKRSVRPYDSCKKSLFHLSTSNRFVYKMNILHPRRIVKQHCFWYTEKKGTGGDFYEKTVEKAALHCACRRHGASRRGRDRLGPVVRQRRQPAAERRGHGADAHAV